jgi:hypothetical protein
MYIKDYWEISTFKIGLYKFFCFHRGDKEEVDIYNENCDYYGAWMSAGNFKKDYKKCGESLNLTFQEELTSQQ